MNDVIAKRCKCDVGVVFARCLILSIASYVMAGVCFFLSDPTILVILILGIILILVGSTLMFFGIRSLKSNIKNNKLPKDAICLSGDELIIYNETIEHIKIKDIIKVKSRHYYRSVHIGDNEFTYRTGAGVLLIKTSEKTYKVYNINDIDDVCEIVNDIKDGKYHKTENIFNNIFNENIFNNSFNMDNNSSVYNSHDVFISINGEKTYSSKDSFDNEDNRCIFSNDDIVINVEDGDLNITIKKE